MLGLGVFEDMTHVEGPHYSFQDKIIYFKKGELVCGEEIVGLNENSINPDDISISPNPADEYVSFYSPIRIKQISLISISGKIIISHTHDGKDGSISLSHVKRRDLLCETQVRK